MKRILDSIEKNKKQMPQFPNNMCHAFRDVRKWGGKWEEEFVRRQQVGVAENFLPVEGGMAVLIIVCVMAE